MFRVSLVIFFIIMALSSCQENSRNPNKHLTIETFAALADPQYKINPDEIRHQIKSLMRADNTHYATNRHVRKYYDRSGTFIWIDYNGVFDRADTLLRHLRNAVTCGIDTSMLRTEQIALDIKALRTLNFNSKNENINKTIARLEYNLTRAYFLYSAGQQYGFVNPDKLYNNLEKCDSDTVSGRITFSHLSNLRVNRPDSVFFITAVKKAFNDSVGPFITSVQPHGTLYSALLKRLNSSMEKPSSRIKTLCNIERCRWRQRKFKPFEDYNKYVFVNIPACSLLAVNGDKIINMRVGIGAIDHKTPMLSSYIKRMDINPQWIIPKSIAKEIVGRHSYMHSEGMFVIDKAHGKMPPEAASLDKVMASKQYIVQAGGSKNPLGRIIFRFDNDFAVYLHDTSSPWVFKRNRRDVSHGCVRVERPFDLAEFMLDDKDTELTEKLKYSMTVPFVNDNDSINKIHINKELLVNTVNISPQVPIFIAYYTVFYGSDGKLMTFDDIYGYDEALTKELLPFIK